jgi:hypothetical protein
MKTTRTFWSILTMLIVASCCLPPVALQLPKHRLLPRNRRRRQNLRLRKNLLLLKNQPWRRLTSLCPGGALEEALKGTYAGTTVTVDGALKATIRRRQI